MGSPRLLRAAAIAGVVLTALLFSARAILYFGGGAKRHHVEAAAFLFTGSAALALVMSRQAQSRAAPCTPKPYLTGGAILVALAAVGYSWWTMPLGFLSDDFVLLARAVEGRLGPGSDWPFFRPLPLLLWSAIAYVSDSPFWFHALNVLIHAANVVLVYVLAEALGLAGIYPLAAAGLFAFWPAHIEAVAWASGVQDLLMTFGVLLFLLGSLAGRWIPALTGLAVAIGSKEVGVVAPVLGLLLWVGAPRGRRPCGSILIAAGALVVAYAAWRLTLLSTPAAYAAAWPTGYVLKELVGRPFATLAVPVAYGVVEAWRFTAGACVILFLTLACIAVLGGAWTSEEKGLSIRLMIAVVVSVLPVYSLLHISPQLEGSRYVYLASVFWSLLLAIFAQTLSRRSQLAVIAAHALLALMLAMWVLAHASQRIPWSEAAKLRDAVLISARDATARCDGRAVFTGAPDSINGAYVFRNGLAEAVMRAAPSASPEGAATCRYVWKDGQFVAER